MMTSIQFDVNAFALRDASAENRQNAGHALPAPDHVLSPVRLSTIWPAKRIATVSREGGFPADSDTSGYVSMKGNCSQAALNASLSVWLLGAGHPVMNADGFREDRGTAVD